ncbi:unnamed protein product [Effrenium voratum]|uniref:Uncharacterized protein n=1 Tax=Effrenium voratum TaxID=2562239 RepID=A0AA36N2F0_9DINO|nr:unnamed protein product [Effrenium voratum]CAJ1415535.1 unnamed protein product [Effrenium voratum]|mmetsp:Transcript_78067/g.187194  ORF Transcript_78067/g.187194 Transcript_78067/m.187194 type:complete len:280 (-) Transcript_78067:206-1045(-)
MPNGGKEPRCDRELDASVTSLILRRLPPSVSNLRLVQILEEIVPGKYDFVHVPHEQQTGQNIALAFINFVDHESARKVFNAFLHSRGRSPWHRARATPGNIQGLGPNLAYFLTRFGVEALDRPNAPMVFVEGVRVPVTVELLKCHLSPEMLVDGLQMVTAHSCERARTDKSSAPTAWSELTSASSCHETAASTENANSEPSNSITGRHESNRSTCLETSGEGSDSSSSQSGRTSTERMWASCSSPDSGAENRGASSTRASNDNLQVPCYLEGEMIVFQL